MALIGVIRREQSSSGIDLARWRVLAATDPRLKRPPPREIINPFTGKPAVHIPADTDADILQDILPIGTISVAESDEGELAVWGSECHRETVETIARSIAADLEAEYLPLP